MSDSVVCVSGLKLLAVCLAIWAWVRAADWINTDAYDQRLPYLRWNAATVGAFAAGFVMWLAIPWFWLGYPLLLTGLLAPFVVYVVDRNDKVEPQERVFTAAHLRFWLAHQLAAVGVHIAAEADDPHESGPVKLAACGGPTEKDEAQRLLTARQKPGFNPARAILAEALAQRATALVLGCGATLAARTHIVDGLRLDQEALPLNQADPIVDALMVLCGLAPAERKQRQEGTFLIRSADGEYPATLEVQAVPPGRRASLLFTPPASRMADLNALGMRPKMQQQLGALLAGPRGLFLFAAPPDAGLRTLTHVALRSMDRFVREFVALEAQAHRYEEVENVPVVVYDAAAGETAATILPRVLRKEPQVIVVRDLNDQASLRQLCGEALSLQIVGTVRARDVAEALVRVGALHGAHADFARSLTGAICQRLVRKLCPACKVPQRVSAEIERRWGLPADRISEVFQPPSKIDEKGRPRKPCPACGGVGYAGRTAIYELLAVSDEVRALIAAAPKAEALRPALLKSGMHGFQEEGLVLVAKGVTSLAELQRALGG